MAKSKKITTESNENDNVTRSLENIENVDIKEINDSNGDISVIEKEEFDKRVKAAIIKHKPEHITEESNENEIKTAQSRFAHDVGRQISNHFPDMPTGQIISLLGLMFEGKYQNDAMLNAIEEMPVGGYGY